MALKTAEQSARHNKLHVRFNILVIVGIDLRNQRLEIRFERERVHMGGTIGMAPLRRKQPPDHAIGRDRIT